MATSIRVPLQGDPVGKLDAIREKAKQLRSDLKDTQRDMLETARAGMQVSKEVTDNYAKMRRDLKNTEEVIKLQKAQMRRVEEQRRDIEGGRGGSVSARDVRMKVHMLQELAKGELSPHMIRHMAHSAIEKLVETDAGRAIAGSKIGKFIGLENAASAVPIVAAAVQQGIAAYQQVQDERKDAASVGRRYISGQLTKSEYEVFQNAEQKNWFEKPGETLKRNQDAAESFRKLKPEQRQKVFDEFNKEHDFGTDEVGAKATGKDVAYMLRSIYGIGTPKMDTRRIRSAASINKKIDDALEKRSGELGRGDLNEFEVNRAVRSVFAAEAIPEDVQEKLIAEMKSSNDSKKMDQKSASAEFWEKEREMQDKIGHMVRVARYHSAPTD